MGSYETLTATVLPDNAANKDITWSSDHPEIATVTDGVVIGICAGSTAISAISVDGGRRSTCAVSVTPVSSGAVDVPVTGVSLNKTALSVAVGDTENLFVSVAPSNATNNAVTWSSTSPARATVSESGLVTGISAGSTIIIVSTVDGGKIVACTVTVTESNSGNSGGGNSNSVATTSVTLNKTSTSLSVGGTEALASTVAPSKATNKSVIWSSNAPSVV